MTMNPSPVRGAQAVRLKPGAVAVPALSSHVRPSLVVAERASRELLDAAARHLGSVDWSYDTPAKHYVTIYRVMVTQAGVETGETTLSILSGVLALGGLPVDGARITLPAPPPRDPFRSGVARQVPQS